ncbi:EAL domain-containing protein [Radicibacter daui]|uniref:EAL domain-containing protein n=1 Tax=Radicibacter daui TaxID=3064829 RepID=UPI004046B84C
MGEDLQPAVPFSTEQELLSYVADQTDRVIVVSDPAGRALYVNRAFTTLFGYGQGDVLGRAAPDLVLDDKENGDELERLGAAIAAGERYQGKMLASTRSGRKLWVSMSQVPVFTSGGALRCWGTLYDDVTHRKQLQLLQHKVLAAVVRDVDLLAVWDILCREVEAIAPEVVCSVVHVDERGFIDMMVGPSLSPRMRSAYLGLGVGVNVGSCGTAVATGLPVLSRDIANDPKWQDFKEFPLSEGLLACWSSPIMMGSGRAAGAFAFYYRSIRGPSARHTEIVEACVDLCALAIERSESSSHIRRLAHYDPLTGLPNRTFFRQQMDEALGRMNAGETAAVFYLDLSRLRQVNEALGHDAGDELLLGACERLRHFAGTDGLVGRLGGEELLLLRPGMDEVSSADLATALLAAFEEPVVSGEFSLSLAITIGISLFPADGASATILIRQAGLALNEARRLGQPGFRFFNAEASLLAEERLKLEGALHDALLGNKLELYYQPQIGLSDGKLHGVEALARWKHPSLGPVSPAEFVPLAEVAGLGETFGKWALRTACRQLGAWRDAGLDVPCVSVNLSPQNFRSPDLARLVEETLRENHLPPQALTLEITESAMMDHSGATRGNVDAIAALGVQLSVDDFGTGYSSLSLISRLPIKELKIDRSFVFDLEESSASRAIASSVIGIGDSLGLTIVAEGVENRKQCEFLEAHGCEVVQGYLLSPPVPADELEHWLRDEDGTFSRFAVEREKAADLFGLADATSCDP